LYVILASSPFVYVIALYSAATSYYNQKQTAVSHGAPAWQKKDSTTSFGNRKSGGGRGGFSNNFSGGYRKKAPNLTPVQSMYCEVCKISCAGPQVWSHLMV